MTATTKTTSAKCGIVTVGRQITAVIKAQVAMDKLPEAQRSLRSKIDAAIQSLDVAPLRHAFTLWRPPIGGRLDMEPGILVSRMFEPVGEVVPSALPAGRTAHFLHMGSYEGIPGAWQTLFTWCAEENLKLADINWEIYGDWNDDSSKLETSMHALLA